MLIYDFSRRGDSPLYEYLYSCLKADIINGRLPSASKLPSKRELAQDNKISVRTVMNAYEQLLTEGYITSVEKSGYFVANIGRTGPLKPSAPPEKNPTRSEEEEKETWLADFTANHTVYEKFPFSLWSKMIRRVLSTYGSELIKRPPFLGVQRLRSAIAQYLYRSRGIIASPEQIVIAAGIEYLYCKLIQILPKEAIYAMESPGYRKIPLIYDQYGVNWRPVEMDGDGISMEGLRQSGACILHCSPEHHFPLGRTMGAARRSELLNWAAGAPDRYIIEDDYDCEFRYHGRPIPALFGMDPGGHVIYMNTFSKTLAPSIRISYMVLPESLVAPYALRAGIYSNSASVTEQYALAHFIEEGYFERHLSRLRKYYRQQGGRLLRIIKQTPLLPLISVTGGSCGTHLLVKVDTPLDDDHIKEAARAQGIKLSCLSDYCTGNKHAYRHVLVLNYSDLDEHTLLESLRRLAGIFIEW